MGLHILFRIQRKLLYAFLSLTLLFNSLFSVYGAKTASCTTHLTSALTHIKFIVEKQLQTFVRRFLWRGFTEKSAYFGFKKLYAKNADKSLAEET